MDYHRLTERIDNYIKLNTDSPYADKMAIERLAELEDKIEDGRLKEFPCKVGDNVCKFNARSNGDIWVLEAKCLKIEINKKGTLFTFSTLGSRYLEEDFFADINGEFIETDKYYVCDRTEAEKRLKELKLKGGE